MNRMVRRAEQKKEAKVERDKAKAKREREQRREQRRAERRAQVAGSRTPTSDAPGSAKRSNPGRFSGALMAATVFFIALQAVAPTDPSILGQVVSATFYLLFAYFAVLWMMRLGRPRPVTYAVAMAGVMGLVTGISQWLQPALIVAPVMLAAVLPLAYLGAILARAIYVRAP